VLLLLLLLLRGQLCLHARCLLLLLWLPMVVVLLLHG
jgi:hypothetical protein